MKQKDIALIIVAAAFAAAISFFLANKIFITPQNRTQNAQVVDAIQSDMARPDTRFFNGDSINPSRITTDGGTNQTPFNSTTH